MTLSTRLRAGNSDVATTVPAWVQTYAGPDLAAVTNLLEGLLEEHGDEGPAVRAAYRKGDACGTAFFRRGAERA